MMNNENKTEQKSQDKTSKENDSSLEALVRQEQSVARKGLTEELGREPTQEEIDRWLSGQTEGY
jgi:hypothetical protein